jgi:hypothetical protein
MVMNIWECSHETCGITLDIDNLLGYDIIINAICDGTKIIKIEVKPNGN